LGLIGKIVFVRWRVGKGRGGAEALELMEGSVEGALDAGFV